MKADVAGSMESLIRKNVILVYEGAEARYRLPHPVLQRTRKP